MNKKLLVLYRAYGGECNGMFKECRPEWFSKEACFKSIWDNFSNNPNVEIKIVFDGDTNNELYKYIIGFTKNIINVDFKEDSPTLIFCHKLAAKLDFDYIYFVEDDFLHLNNSYEKLIEGLDLIKNNGFVSLYDHLDRYIRNDDITLGKEYIILGQTGYWRTAESTTNTVAMSKNVLLQTLEEKIQDGNKDRLFFVNCIKKYNLRLITPLPAKATHVNKYFYSPFFDWEKVSKNTNLL